MEKLIIKIYGTGTSTHQHVKKTLNEYLTLAGCDFTIVETTDVQNFISKNLKSVPTVEVDEKFFAIKKNGEFQRSLYEAVSYALKKVDYGKLTKILVPVDFSPTSINAFYYAKRLAAEMHAIVYALHVYRPEPIATENLLGYQDFQQEFRNRLTELTTAKQTDWGGTLLNTPLVEPVFKVGFASESILSVANEVEADYVVMGSTGSSGVGDLIFGSVSKEIARRASCPVLLIPDGVGYSQFRNVIYGCKSPALDMKTLPQLCQFVGKSAANIQCVHIKLEETREDYDIDLVLDYLDELGMDHNITFTSIVSDDIAKSIDRYVAGNDIDCITLGTKSRNFLNNLFHKSTLSRVRSLTKKPILVLK